MFLDFCIMCGTDYNKTIPKIGFEKSFKLIKEFTNLENIENHLVELEMDILNYKRIREIFNYKENEYINIIKTECNLDELKKFCLENNCIIENFLKTI